MYCPTDDSLLSAPANPKRGSESAKHPARMLMPRTANNSCSRTDIPRLPASDTGADEYAKFGQSPYAPLAFGRHGYRLLNRGAESALMPVHGA